MGLNPDKSLRLGDFSENVKWKDFIVLLISLASEDIQQAVQLLFEVFSDEGDCSLTVSEFMPLFRTYAARDRRFQSVDGFIDKLTEHMQEA